MRAKSYLLNRLESRVCRLNGILHSSSTPDKPELRQSFADHVLYTNDQLPPKVDLRMHMTPVEDQSKIGSCVANSLAGVYEYLTKKGTGCDVDVSRLFIYYNARVHENEAGALDDTGCSMTSGIQALEQHGVCLESIWPYDTNNVNQRPQDEAYRSADGYRITEALQVDIDLDQMKSCLAQGFPFAFGLKLFTSFDKAAKSGVVPLPDASERSRQSHGSHALLAVGYSDQSNAFIVRNSWGEYWGDRGYCYIPYAYVTNPELCFDVWTVRQLTNEDFGQEHWDNDDSIDYQQTDATNGGGGTDENESSIEHYDNDDDLSEDLKKFGQKMLGTFISMVL